MVRSPLPKRKRGEQEGAMFSFFDAYHTTGEASNTTYDMNRRVISIVRCEPESKPYYAA